jgi:hypothetical protein
MTSNRSASRPVSQPLSHSRFRLEWTRGVTQYRATSEKRRSMSTPLDLMNTTPPSALPGTHSLVPAQGFLALVALAVAAWLQPAALAQVPLVEVDLAHVTPHLPVGGQPPWNRGPQPLLFRSVTGFDLRNPWSPSISLTATLGQNYYGFAIDGPYIYTLNNPWHSDGGLTVFRIDSGSPSLVCSLPLTNCVPIALSVDRGLACILGQTAHLATDLIVLDTTRPESARVVFRQSASYFNGVLVAGDKALLTGQAPWWEVVDLQNPAQPVWTNWIIPFGGPPGDTGTPVVGWPFVYSVHSGSLRIADFSDPASPQSSTVGNVDPRASLVRVAQTLILAVSTSADGSARLQAIDISDPRNPRLGNAFQVSVPEFGFSGRWLFAQTGIAPDKPNPGGEVTVWDLSDPAATTPVARFKSIYGGVTAWGRWVYVKPSSGSMTAVYDVGAIVDPDRAAATATAIGGFVVQVDVKRPGAGYAVPPNVRFVASAGSGAEARAVLDDSGGVVAIQVVSPGSGYPNDTRVEIQSPDQSPRTALAVPRMVNGFLVGWEVTDPGWGYVTPPEIRLMGPTGAGSVSEVVLGLDGTVDSIRVLNPGSGYAPATTARIQPPVVPEPQLVLSEEHRVLRGGTLTAGRSYEWQEHQADGWRPMLLPLVTNQPSATVFLEGPGEGRPVRLAELPLPVTATATPSVVNGFLVDILVGEGGSGYSTAPAVQIVGGGGTGAAGTAEVAEGRVVRIVVDNPGRGYVEAPWIVLDAPPVSSVAVSVLPALRLEQRNLSRALDYRLQASEDLQQWTDLTPLERPAAESVTTFLTADSAQRFFRLQRSPW